MKRLTLKMGIQKPMIKENKFNCRNSIDSTNNGVTKQKDVNETIYKMASTAERSVITAFRPTFEKINPLEKPEEQIDNFLLDIGMPINDQILKQVFLSACTVKKVTYNSIILDTHNNNPKIPEKEINSKIKQSFSIWIEKHPEMKEKKPRIFLITLIKVFALKFRYYL